MSGIVLGAELLGGAFLLVLVLRIVAVGLAGTARLAEWSAGRSTECGEESHTDRCVLHDRHFGWHQGPARQRNDGTWYRVRFTGSRWSGSVVSVGEDCDPPKHVPADETNPRRPASPLRKQS